MPENIKGPSMTRNILCLIVAAVMTAATAGCGQKGPLHLPGDVDAERQERD